MVSPGQKKSDHPALVSISETFCTTISFGYRGVLGNKISKVCQVGR